MITIRLDPNKHEPLYEQLYQHIRREITSGRLTAGSRLPSKRQLSAHLQCSLNTVQTALGQLVAEGYLEAKAKSGYYVRQLDGVVSLQERLTEIHKPDDLEEKYQYDFSYQGVDPASFPFATWRRLARQTSIQYEQAFLKASDPQGDISLRLSISKYLHQARGVRCRPEQIVISSGTESLLQLLIQLFEQDKVFAIESPGYEKLSQIFRSNRTGYHPIVLDAAGMVVENLADSGADICCITPSHQFPTGVIMPVGRRIQLLNWANENPDRYIIEDDYDSEFRFDGRPIPSLQGMDQSGKVIYLGSFSKSISPSLRISYMVLPNQLIKSYREQLGFYICPVPILDQKTLSRFIEDGHFERHLNRMRNSYKEKREELVRALSEFLPSVRVLGANAGLHLVIEIPFGKSESDLIQLAELHQIRVFGISALYSDNRPNTTDPRLILGFASLKTEDIPEAVRQLRQAWTA